MLLLITETYHLASTDLCAFRLQGVSVTQRGPRPRAEHGAWFQIGARIGFGTRGNCRDS